MKKKWGSESSTYCSGDNTNKKRKLGGLFRHSWRDWACLPSPLVADILNRSTTIDDYVRFGAVCKSWQVLFGEESRSRAAADGKKQRCCWQPFLLVGSPNDEDRRMLLYSLSTKKFYDFDVNLPFHMDTAIGNKFCRGCSFGWLITMEIKGEGEFRVQLHNPFLPCSRIIHLPPLDSIVKQYPMPHEFIHNTFPDVPLYVHKAVLSSDPSSSRDFLVAALMNSYQSLAVFDSRQRDWVSVEENWVTDSKQGRWYHDVIFFTRTKQFYAVEYTGEVMAIDMQHGGGSSSRPKLEQVVPPSYIPFDCVKLYLVEDLSSGELLRVGKCFSHVDRTATGIYFEVYKLDPVDKIWIRIHDLAGKILFLGTNTSAIRPASDCPGCQPDSVYYTNDFLRYPFVTNPPQMGDGVYNLVDGTHQLHYHPKNTTPPYIWVDPTLQN